MPEYIVNQNSQPSGEHEVHKKGCIWMPQNVIDLGKHSDCSSAIQEAQKHYSDVDGCKYCCTPCHTR